MVVWMMMCYNLCCYNNVCLPAQYMMQYIGRKGLLMIRVLTDLLYVKNFRGLKYWLIG